MEAGKKAAVERRKGQTKAATLKRKQRAMDAIDVGPDATGNSTKQVRLRKAKGPGNEKEGRGYGNGSKGGRGPNSKKKT